MSMREGKDNKNPDNRYLPYCQIDGLGIVIAAVPGPFFVSRGSVLAGLGG